MLVTKGSITLQIGCCVGYRPMSVAYLLGYH